MDTEVTFKSELFRPVLPEESQVNPGRYGAELAYWLCVELAKVGVVTSYPNDEDWGWFIEYITDTGEEYSLCCANVDGTDNEWRCFIEPARRGFLGRKRAPVENAKPLLQALAQVLASDNSISDIRWSSKT